MATREPWTGGHVHVGKDGTKTYVIRKRIGGKRYEVSTRASTRHAAELELRRFEADPEGYQPGGPKRPDPVYLDPQLSTEFLEWSAAPREEGGKGNSPRWVHYQSKYLAWWEPHLRGVDLRSAPIAKIEAALKDTPSRPHKIEVIKALYSWLVTVKRAIKPAEDPTFRTLKVPQAKAAQLKKKKTVTAAEYHQLRAKLEKLSLTKSKAGRPRFSAYWLDCLDVLAGTGWHVSELERFSVAGEIEEVEHVDGAAVLQVIHKSGAVHRTLVSKPVLAAAQRVRERGASSKETNGAFRGDALRTALQRACDALKIPRVHPGSFRHSVATHVINSGAALKTTSDFLGHKSTRTTKNFYGTHSVPTKVPTLV